MSGTNPVPLTTGLSSGGKDPIGWAGARTQTIDTTGMNIPGMIGKQTLEAVAQAIEADAGPRNTAGGKLWSAFQPLLRIKGNGYTKDGIGSPKWVAHDKTALQNLLVQWNSGNSNLGAGQQPWTLAQYVNAKANQIATGTPPAKIGPKILSISSTATPAQQIDDIYNQYVAPRAKAMGSNLSPTDLHAIATQAWNDGTYAQGNIIDKAISDKTDFAKTIAQDQTANAIGGAIGSTADQLRTVAHNYGIPVPADPNQFTNFVKDAVGNGGDISKFTEYAKAQAVHLYPWMAGFLTGGDGSTGTGGTVAGYLQPYTTNIASTLGIPSTSINWTDPKWQSVVAAKDPKTGVSVPQTLDQALQTVKTDPRFGYDKSVNGINDASNLVLGLKSAMGL